MGEGGAGRSPTRGAEEAAKGAQGCEEGRRNKKGRTQKRCGQKNGEGEAEALGHLGVAALCLGSVFRIDFADHAVAAVALGGVEAGATAATAWSAKSIRNTLPRHKAATPR